MYGSRLTRPFVMDIVPTFSFWPSLAAVLLVLAASGLAAPSAHAATAGNKSGGVAATATAVANASATATSSNATASVTTSVTTNVPPRATAPTGTVTGAALPAATLPAAKADSAYPLALKVAPGRPGEVCTTLQAGDTLRWRFVASGPLAFDLHHHEGSQVITPVQVRGARTHEGQYTAAALAEWCLMWTSPKQTTHTIVVNGEWSVRRAAGR